MLNIPKAEKHLSKDPVLKEVVKQYEYLILPKSKTVFHELVKSIVFQQISYKAAENIHGRFVKMMGRHDFSYKKLLACPIADLRSTGFSNQKCNYVKNIAVYFSEHKIKDKDWSEKETDAILEELTTIKGVGEWTVQMILLFQLEREDIFPLKDLGVQIAMRNLYGLTTEKREFLKEIEKIAEPWAPYRSLAARYLWSWKREN